MGGLAGAAGTFIFDKGLRVLAGLGVSWATKKLILKAEEKEIKKFTPQEGTLGPQPTPAERQEMGERIAKAHVTRGHRGWGGWVAGIAVGIAVGLMLPASVPFAAAAVITGLAGTATEGVIGAVTGGTPVEDSQPNTNQGPPVTGMVPSDDGITVQRPNEPADDPGTVFGNPGTTTTNEGTATTNTTTTTTTTTTGGGHDDPHSGGSSSSGHTDSGDYEPPEHDD